MSPERSHPVVISRDTSSSWGISVFINFSRLIGNCFFKVLFRGVGPAGFEGVQTELVAYKNWEIQTACSHLKQIRAIPVSGMVSMP